MNDELDLINEFRIDESDDFVSLQRNFPLRPTIFLGLGGTGAFAVSNVKRLFRLLYEPRRAKGGEAVAGIPPAFSFLAFDTAQKERPQDLAEKSEWFHLGVDNLRAFYDHVGQTRFYRDWVIQNFPRGAINSGAAGLRNLGRLCLIHNLKVVSEQLHRVAGAIQNTNLAMKINKPIVYVFCSLSGGTGSGMVLDVAFMLRQIMQNADVIGFIGVLEGLPSLTQERRETLQTNTFIGLKELNAFMTNTAEGFVLDQDSPSERYPLGVQVKFTDPFDQCYLISNKKNDGTISLSSHPHVTAFMARLAFMMSAYFPRQGEDGVPGYFEVMDNELYRLTGKRRFIAPGMGQVHFPIEKTADYFALRAAAEYLSWQCGGTARKGDDEARSFARERDLEFRSLREKLSRDHRLQGMHTLTALRYDQVISELYEAPKDNADEILSYGEKMPDKRHQEIEVILKENIDPLFEETWASVERQTNRYLIDSAYLAKGAIDFVTDLASVINEQLALLGTDASDSRSDYDQIEQNWAQVKREVDDSVTQDGIWDGFRDRLQRTHRRDYYIQFLNDAEMTILQRVRDDVTKLFLTKLKQQLENYATRLQSMFGQTALSAVKILDDRAKDLAATLYFEAEGRGASVTDICSFNVMTKFWRDDYFKRTDHLRPENVLNELVSQGNHPAELLRLKSPKGVTMDRYLAQHILKQIVTQTDYERKLTPMEILKAETSYKSMSPEEIVQALYFKMLQPQMEIHDMKNRIGSDPDTLIFCGGLDSEMEKHLRSNELMRGADLHVSDNLERNRLNFFKVSLPVAMAGCDMLNNVLGPQYDRWVHDLQEMSKEEREFEMAKFHCYPRSFWWPDPRHVEAKVAKDKELFGRALAISEMLEVSADDSAKMVSFGKTPKDKMYAFFQIGRGQFWVTPFFRPRDPSAQCSGRMRRLASNVFDSFNQFGREDDLVMQARLWVEWFTENWSQFFNGPEAARRMQEVIKSFAQRKNVATDPQQIALWDELTSAVRTWEEVG